jgi:RHS repeat-associated protein
MRLTFASFLASLLAAASLPVLADGVNEPIPSFYQEPGLSPNRGYVNQHANEKIDPFTGKLQWHFTDIFIPGNGGMDLKVQRSYSSVNEIAPDSSAMGLGWTMHFGRVLRKASAASGANLGICVFDNELANQDATLNRVLELSDGSRHILYYRNATSAISPSFWLAECVNGDLIVKSPDGTSYKFSKSGPDIGEGAALQTAWYVERITDRNGNYINVSYAPNSGPNVRIQTVTTSDQRQLSYTYTAGRLESISDGSRTWTYSYQPVPERANQFFLTEARRPDGAVWKYEYNPTAVGPGLGGAGGLSMKKIVYPTGGEIEYTYDWLNPNRDPNSNPQLESLPRNTVVKQKKAGSDIWTYTYTPASAPMEFTGGAYTFTIDPNVGSTRFDKTVVSGPEGMLTYYHVGYPSTEQGSVYLVGSLVMKVASQIVNGQLQMPEIEAYSWEPALLSTQPNQRPLSGQPTAPPVTADTATHIPRLTQKTISRAGWFYTTKYEYHPQDKYNNPIKIIETDEEGAPFTRTITLTYFVDPAKWILHAKKNETVEVEGPGHPKDSYSTLRDFFPENGNLKEENRNGVITQYTYTSQGDVETKKDARQIVTKYSDYYRGIPRTEVHAFGGSEAITVTRTVSDAGNVLTETDGEGVTTRYDYDALNRIRLIEPATGDPIQVEWTQSLPNTRELTRGRYQEKVTFDGFGRQIQVEHRDQGEVITQTFRYDALGRRVFSSYPGSNLGTRYEFNIIGQPLRIKHAFNPDNNAFEAEREFSYSGKTTSISNERGNTYVYTYRTYGDPSEAHLMKIDAPVAAASVTMKRNGLGQLTEVTQGGITREYGYNSNYFLTSMKDPEITGTGVTLFGRDQVGNLTSRNVGGAGLTNFTYDDHNRLRLTTYSDGTSNTTRTYYMDGKLKTVSAGVTLREYRYDGNKNLIEEKLTVTGLPQPFIVTYGHDLNDALSGISYSTGQAVTYAPDAFGRPTRAAPFVDSITHHPGGQINTLTYANGVTTTINLNDRKWPYQQTITGSQPLFNTTYGYDGIGNVESIIDNLDSSYNRELEYDDIDRVVKANAPGSWGTTGTISYTDPNGNNGRSNIYQQTLGSLGSLSYTYDSTSNRLTSITGRKSYTFSYDVYGNVTGVTANAPNAFAYNEASNMRCANCGQPSEILYDYDGANMRVRSTKSGASTYFMYGQGGQLLWELAPTGLKEYIYVGGKQVAVRQKPVAATGTHVVSIARAGAAATSGSVSASGISCGSTCMNTYANGTQVSLSAAASAGASFAGWSGVTCAGGNSGATCSFNVVGPVTVTALFTKPASHAVSVAKLGNASSGGSVTSFPAGISCGVDCTQDYPAGTSVTLTASISNGTFAAWESVSCAGGNSSPTCTFTVSGPITAKAKFTQPINYTVSVTKTGSNAAAGTVTSTPGGINCGSDCAEAYLEGTSITLNASTSSGVFAGWSGVSCNGGSQTQASCTFTLNSDQAVSATFNTTQTVNRTLTVSKTGTAAAEGTVTSTPAGINCGADCSESYVDGTSLTLTAATSSGVFAGWSGVTCNGGNQTLVTCSFTLSSDLQVGASFGSTAPSTRARNDFSGDGKADVLLRTSTGSFHLWVVDGATITGGALAIPSQGGLPAPPAGWAYAGAADFNGDGKSDVLLRSATGELYVWLVDGASISGSAVSILGQGSLPIPPSGWSIAGTGDFNGDGKSDLLFRDAAGTLHAWMIDGASIANSNLAVLSQGSFPAPPAGWAFAGIADFNADGKSDVLLQNSAGELYVWLGNAASISGGLIEIPGQGVLPTPPSGSSVMGTGDFNGDGKGDLLIRNASGLLSIWLVNGNAIANGSMALLGQGNLPTMPNGWAFANTADYNGDGKADVIIKNGVGQLHVWLVDGANITGGQVTVSGQGGLPALPSGSTILNDQKGAIRVSGDFGGDGRADLLWRNDVTGEAYVHHLNGLTVSGGGTVHNEPNLAWRVVAQGDFNGDGKQDILWWNNTSGQVYMMLMDGVTVISGGTVYTEANTTWRIVGAGDLNGDGRADILWHNNASGLTWAYLMNGLSVVDQGAFHNEPDLAWKIVAIGDLNGDKKADIVWRNSSTGSVWGMLMSGLNVTGQGLIHSEPNQNWKLSWTADFNGDGRADLLWNNHASGEVYVQLMNGLTIAQEGSVYTTPDNIWKVVYAGDINDDGNSDVILHHGATGHVYGLLMNGLALVGQGVINHEPNLAWKIVPVSDETGQGKAAAAASAKSDLVAGRGDAPIKGDFAAQVLPESLAGGQSFSASHRTFSTAKPVVTAMADVVTKGTRAAKSGTCVTKVCYVHSDHLGTPRAITRPVDNQIVWRWDNTEPFGNNAANENPIGLGTFAYNLRFPGQYVDQETGTSYNYFRDYDPATGSYRQSDPAITYNVVRSCNVSI